MSGELPTAAHPIRPAAVGEAALVAGIIREAFQDPARRFGLTAENCPTHPSNCTEAWVAEAMRKGVSYFVLQAGGSPSACGAPCGCVALEDAGDGAGRLERLAVLPASQGKGYGQALVRRAFAEARARGMHSIRIGIIAQDDRLRRWYEKLGFRPTERRRFVHLPFEVLFMDARLSQPAGDARRVFGQRAAFYVTSASHTDAQVLARVVELAAPQPHWRALDVATGAGHTAFALAPCVARVTGVDVTPEMLAEAAKQAAARGFGNVEFCEADAHALPFADGAFDLVTCRRGAHHFMDLPRALREMARVLKPGGRLVIDDRSVPEDGAVDELMNELDRLHDPSHVREWPASEWRRLLTRAGFVVEAVETYSRHRPVTSLSGNAAPEDARRIMEVLRGLPAGLRRAIGLREVNGELCSTHWFVMASARLTAEGI